MTPYEQLVVELTQASFPYQSVYRQGGTPYKLTSREPLPYGKQIEEFARLVEQADCILIGGASGLSAAGGGDFFPSWLEFPKKMAVRTFSKKSACHFL